MQITNLISVSIQVLFKWQNSV